MDGLTALGIVVFNILFGLISIVNGKKKKADLLIVVGYVSIFVGCFWLGPVVDFFLVLLAQTNIHPIYLYSIISYMWMAPAAVSSMYLGAQLLAPKKKRIITVIYLVVGLVFELLLWFDYQNTFSYSLGTPGEDLIDASFNQLHPAFFIVVGLLVSLAIFLVIGSLIKAKQTTGDIRKKFIYITIGFTIFLIVGIADSLFPIGPLIGIFRIIMMTFSLWLYLGLRP